MHFVHFADMIGCNNMLMLKVCKSFCTMHIAIPNFIKIGQRLQSYWNQRYLKQLSNAILHYKNLNF